MNERCTISSIPRRSWSCGRCEHGYFLVARLKDSVAWLELGEHADALHKAFQQHAPQWKDVAHTPPTDMWVREVVEVLEGRAPVTSIDVHLDGTPFQIDVWRALRAIPLGETRSYKDIAEAIHKPTAARAVGRAVGQNRIAVLVPCHRILRADGGLSGFKWGVALKRALLAQESPQAILRLEGL